MKKLLLYTLLVANTCTLVSFWWHFSGPLFSTGSLGSTLIALGRLAGLLATMLILLQLILIGRVKWVESVFGLDRLSRIHRWQGYTILGLVVLHPILLTQGYAILNQTTYLGQYTDFLKNWDELLKAFLGYIILMATVVLSVTIVRKRLKYELWYYVHILNYVAIALVFGHQLKFGSDAQSEWFRGYWYLLYLFAFSNLIWFRFARPILNFYRHRFTVEKVVSEGPATSIYISGRKLEKFKTRAGQFMIFRFLQKGFWWQAHPFSISMQPNGKHIRITAKKLGDYTTLLPELQAGTKVIIDGPHGVFTEQKIRGDKLLFIAGGIGITPIRSLLESLGGQERDVVLLYANKTKNEIVFEQELETLRGQYGYTIIHVLNDEQLAGYEYGRIDEALIRKLVPDCAQREVFLCGPPPMMAAIRNALHVIGVPKDRIYFERFAL